MQLLEKNCSIIISTANAWLEKNKDRSQSWLDSNFPAMFLHLCKGNSEFSFLKDIGRYNLLRNRNFRYKVQDNRLVEVKFVRLYNYYYSDEQLDTVNETFRLTLPVTFGLGLLSQQNDKISKYSPLKGRYTNRDMVRNHLPIEEEEIKMRMSINSSQWNLNSSIQKLQKFFTN